MLEYASARPEATPAPEDDSPMIMPLTPFARSRRSAGTRMVTMVGRAMVRILLMTTPRSTAVTKIQSLTLPALVKASGGVER